MNAPATQDKKPIDYAAIVISLILILDAGILFFHGWRSIRVEHPITVLRNTMKISDSVTTLDLQIENVQKKLKELDPGPPPAWYSPSYYYDWLPRSKIHMETQESLIQLKRIRATLLKKSNEQMENLGKVWNFGVAPILHFLLAISLLLISARITLRAALIAEKFGWAKL